jgi:S-DNA-T family DNA segregation ATPase FtsK/SpoIIIE
MTPLVLPLTVRTEGADLDLLVALPAPTTWADIRPAVLSCTGLASETVVYLGVGPVEASWLLGIAPLLAGTILSTAPRNVADSTGSVNLSCIAGPDAGGWVGIGDGPVIVGRHPGCDLSIDDPELSRWHARFERGPGGLLVDDLSSANGIRVDGVHRPRAGPSAAVPAGGFVRMGGSVVRIGLDAEPGLLITPDGAGHLSVARPARMAPPFHFTLPDAVGPPPERSRRPLPLLAATIGGLAGVAIAIVTGMWSFLLLAALGPVMMLSTALSDRLGGRRSHHREVADHGRALALQESIRKSAVASDRADAWDRYPDPATLARRARSRSSRLWERRPGHPDFLRVCVGIGERPFRVVAGRVPIIDDVPIVDDVPITLDLGRIGVLGLAGDCRPLLRHLLAQLAALHSPADLQLSIFTGSDSDLARLRDLPHLAIGGQPGVLHNEQAGTEVTRLLCTTDVGPMTVLVLDDAHHWRRTPRMNELLERAAGPAAAGAGPAPYHGDQGGAPGGRRASPTPGPPVVAICVADSAEALPAECTAVAVVRGGVVEFAAGTMSGRAEATGVGPGYLEEMIGALAPLLDPDAAGVGLPAEARLGQLIGGNDFQDIVDAGWARPGLTTVVGQSATGPVTIDLERDGPHLLIAGTTGAGKSELLRTLIAGLALAAPPHRTSFLLIDYKGGAAFGPLANLPHTAGVVTDLDEILAARALSGLRAEVHRRERLLADHQVADMSELRRRSVPDCSPALVIVVDEFATLGAELPAFLAGLLDIAQRGRSLGMHLVLATQRPAGVLSPAIKANIGLRICLRVTDDADSIDVIDTPEAARLGAAHAGRALLRSERSRTTMFQVALVSATGTGPTVVARDGHARPASRLITTGPTAPTDLALIVDAVRRKTGGLPAARPPWTPPLPLRFTPSDPEVVGLLDDLDQQQQVGQIVPTGSIMLLGPPGSGRSCGLRRLAWCAAARGACLLVVDPSASLADLGRWPSTRTYLTGEDPMLVQRLVQRLQEALRTESTSGRSSGNPRSEMLVLLDGWDAISGALEALDFGTTMADLADLAARGPTAGLRVAVSAEPRLQHHRHAGAFTSVVRFGTDDRGELRPAVPGRGFLGRNEIQWAYAPAGSTGPLTTMLPWGPVIRPLPTRVALEALPRPGGSTGTSVPPAQAVVLIPAPGTAGIGGADPTAVPIGVGGDDATVLTVDLQGPGGGFLVAGPRRSGVSSTLVVLGIGAIRAGIPVVRPHYRPLSPLSGARDVDLRQGPTALGRLLADHQGPILLLADDLGEADSPVDDSGRWGSVAALLERFVTVAGPGQYLALGTRLDRALRAHRGPTAEVAALRSGVLLQADSADGALLDAVLPRRRGPVLPGRGHLIRAGTATRLQVADPHPST